MKKLFLILALPCVLGASEQKDEKSTAQKAALGTTFVATQGAVAYSTWTGIASIVKSLATGDYFGAAVTTVTTATQIVSLNKAGVATMEAIDPTPPTQTPLEIAANESMVRIRVAEETANLNFMRCLNENADCRDLNARGIPKRCISPARRYAMLNESETARMIARFNKYKS